MNGNNLVQWNCAIFFPADESHIFETVRSFVHIPTGMNGRTITARNKGFPSTLECFIQIFGGLSMAKAVAGLLGKKPPNRLQQKQPKLMKIQLFVTTTGSNAVAVIDPTTNLTASPPIPVG